MLLKELCARNVSAALRETANAVNCCALDAHHDSSDMPDGVREKLERAKLLLEAAQDTLLTGKPS